MKLSLWRPSTTSSFDTRAFGVRFDSVETPTSRGAHSAVVSTSLSWSLPLGTTLRGLSRLGRSLRSWPLKMVAFVVVDVGRKLFHIDEHWLTWRGVSCENAFEQ